MYFTDITYCNIYICGILFDQIIVSCNDFNIVKVFI